MSQHLELPPESPPELESPETTARLPNFLYIGTSKAGSTWIYRLLARHPQVFIAPAKGTYYFDHHFDRGLQWYQDHFRRADHQSVVGELSHSYLYSREAAQRIRELLPSAKLMVCLREPVDRAFSDYLDLVKNGRFEGTFAQALQDVPALTEKGTYATQLSMYLEYFPRAQLHVALFDELKENPQGFADGLHSFLEIESLELTDEMRQKVMPAARPRSRWATQVAKRVAKAFDRVGWGAVRGRAKRSRLVRNILYRPYAPNERPTLDAVQREELKRHFRDEVKLLDELLGQDLSARWGY